MNWEQVNEAYPMAFLEWANGILNLPPIAQIREVDDDWARAFYLDNKYLNIPIGVFNSQIRSLPEYFDALGIHVDTYQIDEAAKVLREVAGLETKHGYSVTVKSPTVWEGVTYATRREALEAGIMKAFEIREGQLKQEEK